jgi:hypothetical protein
MKISNKIPFSKIAKAIRGISVPFFGISWQPPVSEEDIAQRLISFLEDRRVLFYPYGLEIPVHVTQSVIEIRKHLTEIIQELDSQSPLVIHLKAMRASCRKFLSIAPPRSWRDLPVPLGELRGVFGEHIAQICADYKIGLDEEFAEILPVPDE